MGDIAIGIQVYTVRDQLASDTDGTLRALAAAGYNGVERAGGPAALPVALMQRLQAETGLRMLGTHSGLAELEESPDTEIEYCRALGCRYVAVSWTPPAEHTDIPRLAARLERVGRRLAEAGIAFSYHNHAAELAPSGDTTVLDALLAATTAHDVGLELDVAWAAHAGADPVEWLRRYAGRIPTVHIKDLDANREFAPVGEGVLPIADICRAALDGGTTTFIVEHDKPADPMQSVRTSVTNLRAILAELGQPG